MNHHLYILDDMHENDTSMALANLREVSHSASNGHTQKGGIGFVRMKHLFKAHFFNQMPKMREFPMPKVRDSFTRQFFDTDVDNFREGIYHTRKFLSLGDQRISRLFFNGY